MSDSTAVWLVQCIILCTTTVIKACFSLRLKVPPVQDKNCQNREKCYVRILVFRVLRRNEPGTFKLPFYMSSRSFSCAQKVSRHNLRASEPFRSHGESKVAPRATSGAVKVVTFAALAQEHGRDPCLFDNETGLFVQTSFFSV